MYKLKKIICYFFKHKWVYNFPLQSMPNKAICKRCYIKSRLNLTTLDWFIVEKFDEEDRTDEELTDKWF